EVRDPVLDGEREPRDAPGDEKLPDAPAQRIFGHSGRGAAHARGVTGTALGATHAGRRCDTSVSNASARSAPHRATIAVPTKARSASAASGCTCANAEERMN